jgi:uracil-DNA glycosylase
VKRAPRGSGDLDALRRKAKRCRACPLWERATQTVFGAGPSAAEVVFVGEQPGDQEDRQGEPFVGPAGGLLREALGQAGIDESKVYFTNAVKHFKWKPQGNRPPVVDPPRTGCGRSTCGDASIRRGSEEDREHPQAVLLINRLNVLGC